MSRLARAIPHLSLDRARPLRRIVFSALALAFASSVVHAQTHAAEDSTHYVHLMSPVGGQHFYAPGLIRVFLAASDIDNWEDENRAASVEIMVDDTSQATIPGEQSEYWVYKTNLTGIAAGPHRLWARAHFVDGKIFDSEAALITVDAPPIYGQVIDLTGNVTLTGSQNYELVGTPSARIRLNGNGFTINSSASWTGRLTLKNVDIVNLGVLLDPTPGVKVTTNAAIDIENCIFDSTNSLDVTANGSAPATIRANEFRSNMYMNVAQYPINLTTGSEGTEPVIRLQGNSTAQHFFQGNNVGLSTIEVVNAKNWLFGGSTDADTNILMGPRVGIDLTNGTGMQIRRNISDQIYFGGWSQGNNFEMNSGPDLLVEHNLIGGGSWPIRGFGGTFRYNLVVNAGEDWMWITQNNASVHHNIFAEGENNRAGIFLIYGPTGVQFFNNTLDGYSPSESQIPFIAGDDSASNLHSNVFYRFSGTPVISITGTVTANYNLFDNPGVSGIQNYEDNRHPAQDVGALNAQVNPRFATPTPPHYTSVNRANIWTRTLTLKQILALYRGYYTPAAGSPLTDAGDPAGGAGNDIGAIGSGTANAADQFGLLDGGAPASVSVVVSPNAPSLVTAGTTTFSATVFGASNQSVTWSVVESGGGSITSTGFYTAPAIAGTYHVKAVAVADSSAADQATVTVSAPVPPVSVAISPTSAQLLAGATQSFSAAVTGSTNQSVTWSVVENGGGSITSAGFYTAPTVAGTYHVKAIAAADITVSKQATITVTAPVIPVSVAITPTTALLSIGVTQPFTATVTGNTNQSVTWSVVENGGGSITSAGLYTAPAIAGTYHVKAVAVADTTASKQATVTVSAPATPVSVAITPSPVQLTTSAIQAFSATVTGNSNQTVTWSVVETGGGAITSAGFYTAPTVAGTFHVKAVAVADITASSQVTITVNTPVSTPPGNPSSDGSHFVHLMSPIAGQQFFAPGFIRVFVAASDINNWTNQNRATSVEIMVDDTVQTTIPGNTSENIVYKTNLTGIAAGAHRIWARGHFTGGKVFDSEQALVSVDAPPAYAQVVNLTANVALSGTTNYELIGTPTARICLNGNGFTISSSSSWKGRLTLKYVDIVNVGVLNSATAGVKVTTTAAVDIENCIFDSTQALDLTAQATASAILRSNEFRSNMYMNVASQPINNGSGSALTGPVIRLQGNSTAQHFFQGNNVGLSAIDVVNAKNWLFGGSSDADANVLIGPRVGIELENGTGMQIRRNISDQLYFGGWSQGNNFEMNSGSDLVVEHNLISGGSWPVRGTGGAFRYNLVLNADEDWLWISQDNAQVHHNIFAEGASSRAGVFVIYGPKGVQFTNNTLDGFGANQNQIPFLADDASTSNIASNVFYRFHGTPIVGTNGTVTVAANYNLFDNPGVSSIHNYQDNRHPAKDVGALNAQVDPKFATPTPPHYASINRGDIWKRTLTLKQILATYRGYYTPAAGSPLTDAGDPAGGAGNDIGAIGSGAANAADQFGVLDDGTPVTVSVSVLPNSPSLNTGATQSFSATVFGSANQSVMWSVVETADGSITSTGLYTAPTVAGTYHVKAIAVADTNASAQATITVSAPVVPVSVKITPSPVSLTTNATQLFTATVTGNTNQTVTWSVLETGGGSITSAGLYTAPGAAGTFHVKAVAAADTTASAQATITVSAPPPVSVKITPSPVSLTTGATQSFSATVTNSTNQAVTWSVVETGGGSITSAGLYTAPTTAGTFHIKAVASADTTVSSQATVTVTAPAPAAPVINSFTASSLFLSEAGPVTLTWSVTGANSLSISPAVGTVTGTSTPVTVSATTTYTLTATNTSGQAVATTTVTVGTVTGSVAHPRIWLTPTSVATLRSRASSNDAAWVSLRAACDALARLPVEFPDGTGGGNDAIAGGYQYYDYLEPMISLGLGYQTAKTVDATRAANYAAKGRALLLALSDPVHHGRESTDSGWSIRAYGPALALGYDWLYDQLSAAEKVQVYTEINRWISWFDDNGFEHDFPQGNYFAGYYCAKALGALATEGDNPQAAAMWTDWLNRLHFGMVQPYYAQWLSGGGWPEGWNYGPNGALNMLRPIVAAATAKGLDLLHDASKPFAYPEGHALWMGHFTWPDLHTVDDRGFVYESDNPTAADAGWATEYAGLLRLAGGTTSPQAQKYARDIRTATADKAEPWAEFLHWNNAAPETDYKVARSYRTTGDGQVSMRGSWATDAVWGAFQSGPYTGYDGASEQFFDQGALTIKRGGVPFLVNTWGAFMRNSPGTDDSNGWFDFLYPENYDTQTDGVYTGRRIYNTFISPRTEGYWGQFDYGPGETTTTLNHFEDGGAYVVMRGVNLGMMYFTGTPITSWSREVLYVRPNYFLVYDRTSVNSASVNQWQGFHVLRTPLVQSGAAAGTTRYDVIDNTGVNASSPLFRGRVSTLLPVGHTVNVVNVFNSNKVYRLEVHPSASANNTWLTAFDASNAAAKAATAAPLTAANGGIGAGAIEGGYLTYADGTGLAALFSTSGNPPALPLSVTIPAATLNRILVPDLAPNAGYNVTATVANGHVTIQVTAGTTFHASAQGVLALQIDSSGVISPLTE